MNEQRIEASTFKAGCLAVLDDVARSRTSIVITKHGKAIARLVPMDDDGHSTVGSVTIRADDDEAFFTTGEVWDAAT